METIRYFTSEVVSRLYRDAIGKILNGDSIRYSIGKVISRLIETLYGTL